MNRQSNFAAAIRRHFDDRRMHENASIDRSNVRLLSVCVIICPCQVAAVLLLAFAFAARFTPDGKFSHLFGRVATRCPLLAVVAGAITLRLDTRSVGGATTVGQLMVRIGLKVSVVGLPFVVNQFVGHQSLQTLVYSTDRRGAPLWHNKCITQRLFRAIVSAATRPT
jgi:hypothetical protein